MGYFVSVLRERIATFRSSRPIARRPADSPWLPVVTASPSTICARTCAISTSTWTRVPLLRGALRHGAGCLADHWHRPAARSGIGAGRDQHRAQPGSSDISLAQAAADQRIVQSQRAVEIETLKAQAEVEPLNALASQLAELKAQRSGALCAPICAMSGWRFRARHSRLSWRQNDERDDRHLLSLHSLTFLGLLHPGADALLAAAACSASTPSCRSGRCHVYVLFGKVVGRSLTSRAALPACSSWA